jgi:hypothetical protein
MGTITTSAALGRAFLELLPVTGVSIAVFADATKRSTIYASDPVAARIDELQFDLGEGPSFEAVRTSRATLIGNVGDAAPDRWPMFAEGVAHTNAQALFVFPLMMGAICVGVASLYRDSPGDLDNDDVDTGMATARSIAGPSLRHAVRLSQQESPGDSTLGEGAPNPEDAPDSDAAPGPDGKRGPEDAPGPDGAPGAEDPRGPKDAPGPTDASGGGAAKGPAGSNSTNNRGAGTPGVVAAGSDSTGESSTDTGRAIELRRDIHQATGMVLAQLDISPTDAFSRIRAYAYSTNRTVQEVAGDVLARRLDFSQLRDDSR